MKVKTIKRRLDSLIKDFKNKVAILEAEGDCTIHHLPYLDIIIKNQKQHVFYNDKGVLKSE